MLTIFKLGRLRLSITFGLAVVFGVFLISGPQIIFADEPVDIVVEFNQGDFHHVSARFEHTGVVIVDNAGQNETPQSLDLEVSAQLDFDQRFTGTKIDQQAIRKYRSTHAKIRIGTGETKSELSENHKLIVARIQPSSSQRLQMASIIDTLKQRELELIRNPADPLSFNGIFNKRDVSIGDQWNVDSNVLADFLSVDHVYENDIKLVLKSVKGHIAKVYIVGKVKAEVDDVTTEIEVAGITLIDLDNRQLTSLRATIREIRSPGQIAPGFEGQTKIDMKVSLVSSVPDLSDEALTLSNTKRIERRLKWESDQGDFQITYDPRWRVIASETEAAILRFLDNGDLLAQCNIVRLPSRPADKPLELAEFKKEVEKIVAAEETANVVDSKRLKTKGNLTALRVEVAGIESEVPITWIYYHVASADGRRLTIVFTLEKSIADRFAVADKTLVNETFFKPLDKKTVKSKQERSASRPISENSATTPKR